MSKRLCFLISVAVVLVLGYGQSQLLRIGQGNRGLRVQLSPCLSPIEDQPD